MAQLGICFQMGTKSGVSGLWSAQAAILQVRSLPGECHSGFSYCAVVSWLLPLQETVALSCHTRPPTPRSLSSPLRLLVILEAELGSQKVPLKTSSTLPVTPDSREGPLSGHQEVLRFHIHAFSLKRKQNMLK